MRTALCFLFFIALLFKVQAKSIEEVKGNLKFNYRPYELAISNNGTFMPGKGKLGIWSTAIHPGIAIAKHFHWQASKKYYLFQTAKLGYFYHQLAQHGMQAYTELGLKYRFSGNWYLEPRLGAGYLLSIPAIQMFAWKDGAYQKQSFKGRHQLMGGLTLNVGYNLPQQLNLPLSVFLGYQFWVQSPFVNKYVPVLPNNTVQLGVMYYCTKRIKNN